MILGEEESKNIFLYACHAFLRTYKFLFTSEKSVYIMRIHQTRKSIKMTPITKACIKKKLEITMITGK